MKKTAKKAASKLFGTSRIIFWFGLGATLGLFFFLSFVYIFYKQAYEGEVYPGVKVAGEDFSGKKKEDIEKYFNDKNNSFSETVFSIKSGDEIVNATAKEFNLGYDSNLLSNQAYAIGRSENFATNIYHILEAYISGIDLPASYTFNTEKLKELTKPMAEKINKEPVDAKFAMENNKVTEFRAHTDGAKLDEERLKKSIQDKLPLLLSLTRPTTISIEAPVTVISPKITVDKVNDMGIKELVGSGTSTFRGSIENRIFNINLASSRLSGILIKPGEEFSFAKALGDVSSFTGYKQAYIISGGRTILGDGGGVCQVSTTLFRALLNAGLPITERNQHAYRVSYYEQDTGPGVDAAVYIPTVDLKFKNDTDNYLLIQSILDPSDQRLTFEIYGTKDGREVTVSDPVILSQSPAPEPLYQDDPNLPKGEIKQVDFAAPGARVYFTRTVKKDGKVIYDDNFASNYRPWQAVFLRGTKE